MAKLQVNANFTIANSKTLTDEEKTQALSATEGKAKAIRVTVIDAQGNEVVLEGRMYISNNGSLTARVNTKVDNFEIVDVEDKNVSKAQAKEDKDREALSNLKSDLGLL